MTPTPTKPSPWWQTLLLSVANVAIAAVANKYLGPAAGVTTVAAGTAIAHALPSPRQPQ